MILVPTPQKRWGEVLPTVRIAPPKEVARERCGDATYSLEPNFPKRFEAIYCATYEYGRRQVQFLVRIKESETSRAIEPALKTILDDIYELLTEEDHDGYVFKPTPHALNSAKRVISDVYRRTEGRLPRPRVVPDGKGGIIMEWRNGADVVKLGCVSAETKRDYIYYKRGNIYDAVEASVDDLIKWLDWLNHE